MERPNFEMDGVADWRQNYAHGSGGTIEMPQVRGVYDFGGVTFRREGTTHVPVL
jgi:hypothetical protein